MLSFKNETIIVLTASVLFLLFQFLVVGLIPAQILMVFLFNLLFFAHPISRKLAMALLPFVLFEMSYDWMRLYPNYNVNPIDIQGVYDTEKALFGISTAEGTLIPCEYFNLHHTDVADLLAGLFYFCWVPGPIGLAIWLFFKGERRWCLHLTWAFLFVNLIGFMGYYIHPTAPPWYAIEHGFVPNFETPGSAAGLVRFDELVGYPLFSDIYVNNSNIYAAIPSLHAAYMLVATCYAFLSKRSWPLKSLCCVITVGIWWTAVYTCHHYVIDVILGILVGLFGVCLFEIIVTHLPICQRFFQRYTKYISIVLCLFFLSPSQLLAQDEIRTETQFTAGTGEHNPLWLNANKYGLSSVDKTNGYQRLGYFHQADTSSARQWSINYGVDAALATGFTSTVVLQQAYADVRWLKGVLTIGSKEQPIELKNPVLSSGPQTLGMNARPIPSVRLSLPDYWTVPFTRGWLGVKGHIAYGLHTDDNWQNDFTQEQNKHTKNAKIHTKAGYLRIGKANKPVNVELGLEMGCQYGGTSYIIDRGTLKNEDGLKGMFRAFIPSGGETGEGIYENTSGNHIGSYLLRVNMDYDNWYLGVYADHVFEDHSQMFFLDFDGYGEGDEFNDWKYSRWLIYDLKDMMLGVELKLKKLNWLNNIVIEYIYTKYQSGPIYHDRTRHMPDHIAGRDNYYNHYVQTGWQHWGQVMGNPLYRSPLYNDNHLIEVANNRFWAWHIGISGKPLPQLSYRLLASWQRGWGTYDAPLPDPERNVSLLAEADYTLTGKNCLNGWGVKAAVGIDRGQLLGNNTGAQVTLHKCFTIKKQKK